MSTYQKVKAVYDYIIETSTYGLGGLLGPRAEEYKRIYDDILMYRTISMIRYHEGVCHDYSALFMVMTRAIGLEMYTTSGWVGTKSGGKTGHEWAFIKLNGHYYTFDPQVEQSNLVNGQIQYKYFGRSEESGVGLYTYEVMGYHADFAREEGMDTTGLDVRELAVKLFGNFEVECYYDWSGWDW